MGRSDEPLASEGRWQARQLARRLHGLDLAALYCSPRRRTKETAAIVGQPHGLEPQVERGLDELDLSRWEGLSAAEIEAREPEAWQIWCENPARMALPGLEPFEELQLRVRRFLQRFRKEHPDASVAAVTHDGIVRVAVLEELGVSLEHYRAIPVNNTGLTILDMAEERTYVRGLNDVGHLADAGLNSSVRGPADR
jgi:probable phosphoglycerate mutase